MMTAERTCDEVRTPKTIFELFMKEDFTSVMSVGRTHEERVALEIT